MNQNLFELTSRPCLEKIYVTKHIDDNPDLSWLEQEYEDCTPEERAKNKAMDAKLIRDYNNGLWVSIGIVVKANITLKYLGLEFTHEFHYSIWGISSNDDYAIKEYQDEYVRCIIQECRDKDIPVSQYLEVVVNEDLQN